MFPHYVRFRCLSILVGGFQPTPLKNMFPMESHQIPWFQSPPSSYPILGESPWIIICWCSWFSLIWIHFCFKFWQISPLLATNPRSIDHCALLDAWALAAAAEIALRNQLLGIASTLGSWALYGDWGAKAHTTIGGYMWDAFVFEILEHDWTMLVELCYLCWLNWTWWTELCWLNVKLFGQNGLNMIELCWYSWKVKTCRGGGKTMPVLLVNNVVNPISKHPQIYLKWFVLQSSKNRKNMLGFTTITYINEHVQIPFAPAATSSWLIHSPWVNFASARHSVDFPLPCKPRTKTAVSVSSSLSAAIALGDATCARARARASPSKWWSLMEEMMMNHWNEWGTLFLRKRDKRSRSSKFKTHPIVKLATVAALLGNSHTKPNTKTKWDS